MSLSPSCNLKPECDPSCTKVLDPTTDPNSIRFKAPATYHNYSQYECDNNPDNMYKYLVLGQRNPVQCCVSQPFITYTGKNETIDNMATCDSLRYLGYNRNGRLVDTVDGRKLTPFE